MNYNNLLKLGGTCEMRRLNEKLSRTKVESSTVSVAEKAKVAGGIQIDSNVALIPVGFYQGQNSVFLFCQVLLCYFVVLL